VRRVCNNAFHNRKSRVKLPPSLTTIDMFIGIIGTTCSGKKSVEKYLLNKGFISLRLKSKTIRENGLMTSEPANGGDEKSFADTSSMLDYATYNWCENHVATCLDTPEMLEPFMKRPFFLLLSIDAPIFLRWKRAVACCEARQASPPSLEAYVRANDDLTLRIPHLSINSDSPHLRVLNGFTNFHDLHSYLDNLDLFNEKRLRPDWDTYFMETTDACFSNLTPFKLHETSRGGYPCSEQSHSCYRIQWDPSQHEKL